MATDPTTKLAQDLIQGALRKIGQYAPGEALAAQDASDALDTLNGLLDSLSNENLAIFNSNEIVFSLQSGKFSYSIGNELAGTFIGSVNGTNTLTVSGAIPAALVQGATITGSGISSGTTVSSIGASTVTLSKAATGTYAFQTYSYTAPGDVAVQRPLHITAAYSRITTSGSTVDFPCEPWALENYATIGMKSQPGPWPKKVFYNPTFPNGTLIFWPVPNQNVEFHLWADALMQSLSLSSPLNMPQGYYLGLQWMLAELLCPEYGVPVSADIARFSRTFYRMLKTTNSRPPATAVMDVPANGQTNDAGFILHGGFV